MERDPERFQTYLSLPRKDDDMESYHKPRPRVRSSISPTGWSFFVSWGAFIILEGGYLTLAGLAFRIFPLSKTGDGIRLLEVKMLFIVLTILWQYLAIYPIKSLVTQVYNAEWYYLLSQGHNIRGTDKVSTLSSGIWAYISHFFSKNASKTFRLAVIISLLLRLLLGVAPAAIVLTNASTDVIIMLNISDMTIGSREAESYFTSTIPLVTSRAAAIARMEQIDLGFVYGYDLVDNYVIPTPHISTNEIKGDVVYRSDLAQYNFSCNWMLPDNVSNGSISVAGINWTMYQLPGAQSDSTSFTSGIFPLIPTSNNSSSFFPVNETDLSAYLFAGRNSTIESTGTTSNNPILNLDNIPTSAELSQSFAGINSSLSSVLICDPKSNLTNAHIQLTTYGILDVDWRDVNFVFANGTSYHYVQGFTPVGNMRKDASNLIFSTSMLDAVASSDGIDGISGENGLRLTRLAARLFTTQNISGSSTEGSSSFQPLSLTEINAHMNKYFRSASKAFTDGFTFSDTALPSTQSPLFQNPRFTAVNVPATQSVFSALVLSGGFVPFFASVAWVGLIVILTPFLYKGWTRGREYSFTLDSLSRVGYVKEL